MRRQLAVSLFLSLALVGFAQTTKVGGSGKTKVGGSGTTKVTATAATCPSSPSDTYPGASNDSIGADANHYYGGATSWTNASNRNICRVDFGLLAVGTITGNTYHCYIYSKTGNQLNAIVGTSSAVTGNNSWAGLVRFDFPTPAATTGGVSYAIVVTKDAVADASNYVRLYYTSGGSLGFGYWTSAKVDTEVNAAYTIKMDVYWQ